MDTITEARRLFEERARLAAELASVDRRIQDHNRSYCDANGYRALLRPEAFRRAVGA